ncbi:glycoside hydrolase family protein [Ancylobacter lacus]|uniref:hypothetical protein n=1 Tax=Ancylobacter lacus TaxID=2579970 RepID=UPI001BCB27C2|nr:hypothetical protein [Ancylobacter lacus]MBS7538351.1 hypothetical protein [Ancylobacter lacus]
MADGQPTDTLPTSPLVDSVLGNVTTGGTTAVVQVPVGALARRVALDPNLDDGLTEAVATATTAAGTATTAAATAASAALTAASTNARIYATEAAGRAAVVDGASFDVQGSVDVSIRRYVRVSSSTSTLVAEYPTAASVDTKVATVSTALETRIATAAGPTRQVLVADPLGRVLLAVGDGGELLATGLEGSVQDGIAAAAAANAAVGTAPAAGMLEIAHDPFGAIYRYVSADGGHYLPGLDRSVQEVCAYLVANVGAGAVVTATALVTASSAVTGYPIGLDLSGLDLSAAGGDDFRVTTAGGTALPVYWDRKTRTLWVRGDFSAGQTALTIKWGAGGSITRADGAAVWDVFDDFVARPGWQKLPGNPVLIPEDAVEGGRYARDCSILYEDGVYRNWYWGTGTTSINYATSPDGITWTKFGPLAGVTNGRPSVVHVGGTYHLYVNDETNIRHYTATSPGGPFTGGAVVLAPSQSWEGGKIKGPWVQYDADAALFKMWYTAGEIYPVGLGWSEPKAAGYATSPDGVTWTKYGGNPILSGTGDGGWRDQAVMTLHPVKYAGRYYALVSCGDVQGTSRIGFTSSDDGIAWNVSDRDLILNVGPAAAWDESDLYTGTLMRIGSTWRIWYNARSASASNRECTGVATLASVVDGISADRWVIQQGVTAWREAGRARLRNNVAASLASLVSHARVSSDLDIAATLRVSNTSPGAGAAIDLWHQGKQGTGRFSAVSLELYTGSGMAGVLQIVRYVDGVSTVLATATHSAAADTDIAVSATIIAGVITATVAGVTITATDTTWTAGRIGLRPITATVDVASIRVRKHSSATFTTSVLS